MAKARILDFAFAAIWSEAWNMISNISTGLKKFTILAVALLGLALAENWRVCAGASGNRVPPKEDQRLKTMIVAQGPTGVSAPEADSSTSESSEPEPQGQEERDPAAAKKKPLKDFQPTERIEADQAVDFPYDI